MRISAPAHPSATGIGRVSGLVLFLFLLPLLLLLPFNLLVPLILLRSRFPCSPPPATFQAFLSLWATVENTKKGFIGAFGRNAVKVNKKTYDL